MPRGGWLLIIAVIGLALQLIGDRSYAQTSTRQSGDIPEKALQPHPVQPLDLAPINERLERINKAVETLKLTPESPDEYRRAEGDLKAQQDMAEYAMLMTIATGVSVLISAAGVALLLVTLRQNRGAIRIALTGLNRTNRAVRLAERQLIADTRPWIKVEAELVGPLAFVLDGANRVQGLIDIRFTLTNIGKTPALNTLVYVKVVTDSFDARTNLRSQFIETLKQRSIGAKVGRTIFPNEATYEDHSVPIFPDDIESSLAAWDHPGFENYIAPNVLVCVAYDMPGSTQTGETGMVFDLHTVIDTGHDFIKVEKDTIIPLDSLHFAQAIVGGYVS